MLWAPFVLRPDARLGVAALGMAAALLIPAAALFAVEGVQVRVGAEEWIAYAPDGALPDGIVRSATLAVARMERDGAVWSAYVQGDPVVGPGEVLPMPAATAPAGTAGLRDPSPTLLPLLGPRDLLLHPTALPDGRASAALLGGPTDAPGVVSAPAAGSDAFELGSAGDLRESTLLLVIGSTPAAALVAAAFVRLEVLERRRTAATLTAIGHPRTASALLAARGILAVGLGGLVTTAAVATLHYGGAASFALAPSWTRLAVTVGVPALVAAAAAAAVAWSATRNPAGLLRAGSSSSTAGGRRVGFLPLSLRPLAVGTRVIPVLLLAAALFILDVGFPLAVGAIPAAIAGADGEWVQGSGAGFAAGTSVPAAPGHVLGWSPDVEAAVAEVLLPTLVAGRPMVVRGADWGDLAAYHGLHLSEGRADGLVLGSRAAARISAEVGDRVMVQARGPWVEPFRVSGIYEGDGLLEDEAYLPFSTAAGLAGLAPGQASLVRVRPDTPEAEAALARSEPRIEVVGLVFEPAQPAAGAAFDIVVHVVNLGSGAGQRPLVVRLDGIPVATVQARVAGWGEADLRVPAIAPLGPFTVEVNPTASGSSRESAGTLEAPRWVAAGTTWTAQLLGPDGEPTAGVPVRLEGLDGSRMEAVTDTEGRSSWNAAAGIHRLVASTGPAAEVVAGEPADADRSRIEVEGLSVQPADPQVGDEVLVHASLRNLGGAPGAATLSVFLDSTRINFIETELEPGEARLATTTFRLLRDASTVTVGDRTVPLSTEPAAALPGDPASAPAAGPAQPGSAVQAQVARRVLGDARTVLVGLGTVSLAATLSLVFLGSQRVLRGRSHVLGVLESMGYDEDRLRRRAAVEGAALGVLSFTVMAPAGKLLFAVMGWAGWPIVFGHVLPDPVTGLFSFQAALAFGAASSLAAYLASGRVVRESPLRGRARPRT